MQYVGRKVFEFKTKKPPLKGKKRKRTVFTDSGWRSYTGSSKELNKDIHKLGKECFNFRILELTSSKSFACYLEMKNIILHDTLITGYNKAIQGMRGRPK